MAISRIGTDGIEAGAVAPSDLSTGAPSWDGSGNVTVGNRVTSQNPAFCAFTATNMTTSGVATLNQTRVNRGNCYNTSTYQFVAPITGIYWFSAIALPNTSSGTTFFSFRVNGVSVSASTYIINADESISLSQAIAMNAGDYFEMYIAADGFEAGYTQLSGFLIG